MDTSIPQLLESLAQAYRLAVDEVWARHGEPGRMERHGLTTVAYFQNPDSDGAEIAIEIEPDLAIESVRVIAVAVWPDRDCDLMYMRHIAIGAVPEDVFWHS